MWYVPHRLRCFNTWYSAGGTVWEVMEPLGGEASQEWGLFWVLKTGSVLGPKDLMALWNSSTNHGLPYSSSYTPTSSPVSLFVSLFLPPFLFLPFLLSTSLAASLFLWPLPQLSGCYQDNPEAGAVQELECKLRQPGDNSRCCIVHSNRKIINSAGNHRQLFICQTVGTNSWT